MERLTRKFVPSGHMAEQRRKCFDKLTELEDIEEELGIDLITWFKAIRDGVIVNGKPPFETNFLQPKFPKARTLEDSYLYCCISDVKLKPSDYGKTWALTKEELT